MAGYRRILVKLSGEVLAPRDGFGVSAEGSSVIDDLAEVHRAGVGIGVVVGGGNLLRGGAASRGGMSREAADAVGMIGTVINALVLEDALERRGVPARVLSTVPVETLVESYTWRRAVDHLEAARVIVLAGGTGNRYLTTDTAAALRAVEIGAGVLLKATKVDGVYSADPVADPGAERYDRLTYAEVLERRLAVMDAAAVSICREHGVPIVVFDATRAGNLLRVVHGESIGTVVGGEDQA